MKFKDYAILIAINAVVSGVIVVFVLGNQERSNQPTSTAESSSQQAPQTQSMDDHHKPKPAVSTTFDNLKGKKAPDFSLEDYDGKKITLSSLKGKKVVLFFNEGLMCYPACWNQITAFGKDIRFNTKEIATYSIVIDPRRDWKQAIDKMPELASVTVLFDSNRAVSQTYGVLTLNSSMHRGQFPGHTYIIIDKEGIVRFSKDDFQMAVRNDELVEELKKI